jgi:hypothetical protein
LNVSLRSPFNVRAQVSHPYRTTGKIMLLVHYTESFKNIFTIVFQMLLCGDRRHLMERELDFSEKENSLWN